MSDFEDVKQSYVRCMIQGDIVGRFYDIFIDSHAGSEREYPRRRHLDQPHAKDTGVFH